MQKPRSLFSILPVIGFLGLMSLSACSTIEKPAQAGTPVGEFAVAYSVCGKAIGGVVGATKPNSTGEVLICTKSRDGETSKWVPLHALVSNFSMQGSLLARSGDVIPKPKCNTGSVKGGYPLITIIPSNEGMSPGNRNYIAVDLDNDWKVKVEADGESEAPTLNTGFVLVHMHCYYPI